MDIPQANFLTTAEFHKGPDLLRPGTLTGKNVDPSAIAFIHTAFPFSGNEIDIRVSAADSHFIFWPAVMGHEKAIDRESVLPALFGPYFRGAINDAAYEREVYELDEHGTPRTSAEGELIVIGKRVAYDAVELRRLAIKTNLFGRHGDVRGVRCLMLWNDCEGWGEKVERLLRLLDVPDEGLVTLRNTEQWWVKEIQKTRNS
jgi:hypothetical protein